MTGETRSAFVTVMVSFATVLDENQTKAMAKYLSNLKTEMNEDHYDREYETLPEMVGHKVLGKNPLEMSSV